MTAPLILILGQDGLIHEAVVHIQEDLAACDGAVASMRRIGDREAHMHVDRLCPLCFEELDPSNSPPSPDSAS